MAAETLRELRRGGRAIVQHFSSEKPGALFRGRLPARGRRGCVPEPWSAANTAARRGPGVSARDCLCAGRERLVCRGPDHGGGLYVSAGFGCFSDFGKIGPCCCTCLDSGADRYAMRSRARGWDTARGATLFITDRRGTRARGRVLHGAPWSPSEVAPRSMVRRLRWLRSMSNVDSSDSAADRDS